MLCSVPHFYHGCTKLSCGHNVKIVCVCVSGKCVYVFLRSIWCYLGLLLNREEISNFGITERMYVDVQISKLNSSSYLL